MLSKMPFLASGRMATSHVSQADACSLCSGTQNIRSANIRRLRNLFVRRLDAFSQWLRSTEHANSDVMHSSAHAKTTIIEYVSIYYLDIDDYNLHKVILCLVLERTPMVT
mmetsp:Transcript_11516/g.25269  ORF Transcript_11516/g.25269 Transcript_11516/m.25269 type:complete len:110 (-) Transcript_11516:455-784(-)